MKRSRFAKDGGDRFTQPCWRCGISMIFSKTKWRRGCDKCGSIFSIPAIKPNYSFTKEEIEKRIDHLCFTAGDELTAKMLVYLSWEAFKKADGKEAV
jgi:ribosomal protein S27AE